MVAAGIESRRAVGRSHSRANNYINRRGEPSAFSHVATIHLLNVVSFFPGSQDSGNGSTSSTQVTTTKRAPTDFLDVWHFVYFLFYYLCSHSYISHPWDNVRVQQKLHRHRHFTLFIL